MYLLELYATSQDLLKYYRIEKPKRVKEGYRVSFRYDGCVQRFELINHIGKVVARLDALIECYGDMDLFIPLKGKKKQKTRPSRPRKYKNVGRPRNDGTSEKY